MISSPYSKGYGPAMNAEYPETEENLDNMEHNDLPVAGVPEPVLNPNLIDFHAHFSGSLGVALIGFPNATRPTPSTSTGSEPAAAARCKLPRVEGFLRPATSADGTGLMSQGEFRFGPEAPFPDEYPRPTYPEFPDGQYSDWQYAQRRTMQEVVPNVFLGPLASASRNALDGMLAAGLTHVVCVRAPVEKVIIRANHPEHFKYLVIEIEDKVTENVIRHFEPVNKFIVDAVESGGKVLVHGGLGCSRSAVLVIAYIMNRYGVSLAEAYNHAQHKRFCICPPTAFLNQLREYEPIYRARHVVPLPIPDTDNPQPQPTRKRSLSDEEENEAEETPQVPKKSVTSAACEGMDLD